MSEFEYLGPYRIGNVIGRGGMGSVYEATHAKSGEVVAVKLIAQHVADDPRFRRRFEGEVETLRRLRHPGIVRLIGYGEEAGRLFYSMELVHGESLQQRIREVKRMGWLPTVDIAIQVCSALKHAHDIGAIHRDLKPANLILTPANEVKLVDFGITKLFGFGEQTLAGSVLGTADYMAPEQADGRPVTPRTDLYALGSVMYAMMSGRSPFAGKKLTQVIESLKNDRAVPLDLINPDIPQEVVEIVHQLLEKDPQRRPPTALSVMKRLKATRAGLQRGRTVALENEQTRAGDRPLQSEPPTPESDTHHSHLTDASKIAGGQASPSKSPEDSDDRSLDEALSLDGGSDVTNDALPPTQSSQLETHSSATDFVTGQSELPQTRFQSIEADERETSFLGRLDHPQATTHPWIQWGSVVAMVAILAGGVYLFFNAVATPSADELFTIIETAEADGNLTLHENQLERFLIHYPQDDRIEQVRRWESQADLEQTLKRIAAQARRAGGIQRLEPATQSFYKAMLLRESSVEAAQTQLIAWLNVFAPPSKAIKGDGVADSSPNDSVSPTDPMPTDPMPTDVRPPKNAEPIAEATPVDELRRRMRDREAGRLAKLARQELERLIQRGASPSRIDERLIVLRERLNVAESLPQEAKERMVLSLIQLYLDEPWAAPIIRQAKSMLPESGRQE